ncbi:MAG: hypothetical protein BROFUL_00134 [Candidatus Brocadia fulgida]|jgi:predicted nuclease of predicted toxin-antitoxin system|uniref:DUF5615 domain-containing protein n=1 Tax=Candidatus Brocadia fulgida TaxID=380242 RepID=A0A0M2UYH8_9BACT|nr:MAG: hypothetical protein BROFUL_00134 [Candidatus Brocadia fulgida]
MSEKIKFYMDEHVPSAVGTGLQLRGVDVLKTHEAHMLSASDVEHLTFATNCGRVIFTQDDDFLRLHKKGIRHSDIVWAHQRMSIGDISTDLCLFIRC